MNFDREWTVCGIDHVSWQTCALAGSSGSTGILFPSSQYQFSLHPSLPSIDFTSEPYLYDPGSVMPVSFFTLLPPAENGSKS